MTDDNMPLMLELRQRVFDLEHEIHRLDKELARRAEGMDAAQFKALEIEARKRRAPLRKKFDRIAARLLALQEGKPDPGE